jgi:hypothetical protein
VNAVPEQLLEQLEEYLDGALAPEEVERFNARLGTDQELAELLDELRADRETRGLLWRANEPGLAQANAFADRVITAARRNTRREFNWGRLGRSAQFGSAAAACLLLGFVFGWLGRDRGQSNFVGFASNAPAVNQVSTGGPIVSDPSPTPQLGVVINEIRFQAPGRQPVPMLVVANVAQTATAAGGLREGDVLLSIDGEAVSDLRSLAKVLRSRDGLRQLQILRNRQVRELTIQVQP